MRSFSRLGLGAITATSMATSTFTIIVASVLAAELIDEFSISRAQVGFLVTASGLVGALTSPAFGRLSDRLGAVRSVRSTLAGGAIALTALALSPNYAALLGAAFLTGVPNGWGNPSTNALIVDNIPQGSRGMVTGVKQSGVQIGTFMGGLLLPVFTGWWSWRVAVLIFLAMPIGGLIAMMGRREAARHEILHASSSGRLPASVRWITLYGFISGLASSAIIGFLPLFAEEDQGWSPNLAGSIIAAVGLVGIVARILWPHASERRLGHGRTLRLLSLLTTMTAVLLGLAALDVVDSWVLVPAAIMLGAGAIAWNAVGMLAVMEFSPPGRVGKGTGLVLMGFLLGLAMGPPLMGSSVDILGTYAPGWFVTAGLLLTSVAVGYKVPDGSTVIQPIEASDHR